MENIYQYDLTGDGTLFVNGTAGLVSRTEFQAEDLPNHLYTYILYRPNNHRHTWVLERFAQDTDIPREQYRYARNHDDIPNFAYVYFLVEPNTDYMCFDEDDEDVYVEWDTGHTLYDILVNSPEEEE